MSGSRPESSLERIRKRPGMYIGDIGERGYHLLVSELVLNSIEEARAGHGKRIDVDLLADGGCRVRDEGRGIPLDPVTGSDQRILQVLFTMRCSSPPVAAVPLRFPVGLVYGGLLAVNALSRRLVVEVRRDGQLWRQECSRGEPTTPLHLVRAIQTTGTTITFWPDPDIFPAVRGFSFTHLRPHLRELAAFTAGLVIHLRDHSIDPPLVEQFFYPNGLADYLRERTRGRAPVHPTILHASVQKPAGRAEVAFRWNNGEEEQVWSYANGGLTSRHGTHVTGFLAALTRTTRTYLRSRPGLLTVRRMLHPDLIRPGLLAIVSVDLPDPAFGDAIRDRLNSPEAKGLLRALTRECLETFLRDHPDEVEAIIAHVLEPQVVDSKTGMRR